MRMRARRAFGTYGVALLITGFSLTGMGEGSAALLAWFCAPVSLSGAVVLFAPLYWYGFGLAVETRRRGLAVAMVAVHLMTAPVAVAVLPDVASHGLQRELELLRFQVFGLGWTNTVWHAACAAVYLAGLILAIRGAYRIP